jgi:molybdate transport system substrate-binding protein
MRHVGLRDWIETNQRGSFASPKSSRRSDGARARHARRLLAILRDPKLGDSRVTVSTFAGAALGLAVAAAPLAAAGAAELKILAGGSMTASLKELAPRFEKSTGHKLDIAFAATPELIKMATSAPFDAGVVPVDVMKNEAAYAKFVAGQDTIARVGFGVAVRAGAAKPDVTTPEAFKAVLLKASTISTFPASAAGAYVQKVFERLGIAEEMKRKTKVAASPADIPKTVASGEAELGVFLNNVMIAPGVELAGPFPGDLQQDLVFVGATAADSKSADAARAFLEFLKSPEAQAVFKAKGVTPG